MPTTPATSLRVLVVARWYPSHDQPGRGSFVADLVSALRDAGAQVVVASFEATHVRGVAATRPERAARAAAAMADAVARPDAVNRPRSWGVPGVPVARLPVFLDGERRRPSDIADAHAAALTPFGRALADRWPFEVIHAHTGLVDGVVAARLAAAVRAPLLVTEHSSTAPDELAEPQAADLYRGLLGGEADAPPVRVVAVSRWLADAVATALGPSAAGRIRVLPNAVPIGGFPAGAPDARDPEALLYVGSRKATKGIERVLRAFALARAERPGLRLRLIGSPGTSDEEAAWRRLADELAVADAVAFEGAASREAVSAAMRRAALFVHPSPRETFGMVVAEALASGLPVVTAPSGGGDEIVGSDGRFGVVAAGLEPADLAEAILRGLDRSAAFDRSGMRAHVEASFAAPAVAARTIAIYRELMAGGPGATGAHAAAGPDRRPAAVLALARGQAVQRFNLLPGPLRVTTTVITMPPAPSGLNAAPLPLEGTWLELDPDRFVREQLVAIGDPRQVRGGPLGALDDARNRRVRDERARVEGRRDEIARDGVRRFLRAAVGGQGWIVALDADDVLAAEPALGEGVDLAPGGMRWLADRADAPDEA